MVDQADHRIGMRRFVGCKKRGMIEFVLNQYIQPGREAKGKIICQMGEVIPPGKGDDFYGVPLCSQGFHQQAVVEITAAERVKGAVDDQSDFHDKRKRSTL
jgi:hypothetical protein